MNGQRLALDVYATAGETLGFAIADPIGSVILARRVVDDASIELPIAGTYTLTVDNQNANDIDAEGDYAFRLQDLTTPEIGGPDSRGTDFWLAFHTTLREGLGIHALYLLITAEEDASGAVTIPGLGFVHAFDVKAGELITIEVPIAELVCEKARAHPHARRRRLRLDVIDHGSLR